MLEQWRKGKSSGKASLLFADWRGCGHNPDWSGDKAFTLAELAQDYLDLLDLERMQKVNIVGHSLGGLIALQMMLMKPEKINKAFLLDSVGAQGVVFDDSMYEAFRQMAASPELTRTVVLGTILNAEQLPPELKSQIAEDGYKAVRGIGTSVLEILKTVDLRERVQHINVPTLIAHGQEDAIIPLKDSEALSDLLPNAQLEVLSQVGHCWNVENPQEFTKRVRAWFGEE
jgi:pimeloyl-ACP methyl ester carboxylesterase